MTGRAGQWIGPTAIGCVGMLARPQAGRLSPAPCPISWGFGGSIASDLRSGGGRRFAGPAMPITG